MENINPESGHAAAREQLAEIWADPQIRAIARKHADSPQIADDALQNTYLVMAVLPNLSEITSLRGYFCTVLIRMVYREQRQLGPLVDDFARVIEGDKAVTGNPRVTPPDFTDAVCTAVQARGWHQRLLRDRDTLTAAVPPRSQDPARYRSVIYSAAEQILRAGITGEPSEPDSNESFCSSYPEYFDAPGTVRNTSHQRLSRARADVRALLQSVVG